MVATTTILGNTHISHYIYLAKYKPESCVMPFGFDNIFFPFRKNCDMQFSCFIGFSTCMTIGNKLSKVFLKVQLDGFSPFVALEKGAKKKRVGLKL